MKPKDLISPFKTEPKAVLLDRIEKVFYIPARTERIQIGFNFDRLFLREAPIHLEFCSGNGEWICKKAELHPELNWVALEIRFDRVQKIWSKMKNRGISNLFILCGEALDTATHYIPDGSVDAIITDIPYGTTSLSWDSIIPLEPMWIELNRVIKPHGADDSD